MKTLKYLTICLVLCCLFTSHVFGQVCSNEMSGGIAILNANDVTAAQASVVRPGQTVWLRLNGSVPGGGCEVLDPISGDLHLPNGVNPAIAISLPDIPGLLPGDVFYYDNSLNDPVGAGVVLYPYTVNLADMGHLNSADGFPSFDEPDPDEIRFWILLSGLGVTDPDQGTTNPSNGAGSNSVQVLQGTEICITKEACGYSKPGDPIVYTYTVTNCGELLDPALTVPDVVIQSILDTQVDGPQNDLTGLFLAANGGDSLVAGASVQFTWTYEVPDDDPREEIVNTVVVTANIGDAIGGTVTGNATETVDLVHPDYTLDVECVGIEGGQGNFQITFENTGDVELDIESADCVLLFSLVPGEIFVSTTQVPVTGSICGTGGFAELACSAIGTIPLCDLPNELERSDADICDVIPCPPTFTVTKECLSGDQVLQDGEMAEYLITICNTTPPCDVPVPLYFEYTDVAAGIPTPIRTEPIIQGQCIEIPVSIPVVCEVAGDGSILNQVVVDGFCLADDTPVGTQSAEAECPFTCCDPDFTVEKTCLTSPAGDGECTLRPGDIAQYEIIITNTSDCPGELDLFFEINDEAGGIVGKIVGPIPVGGTHTELVEIEVPPCPGEAQDVEMPNEVCVDALYPDGSPTGLPTKCDDATCCYSCLPPEGCTPGFWKNHPDCWCDSYTEATLVSDVFDRLKAAPYDTVDDDDRKSDFDTDTLADSIRYRGGPELAGSVRNMLRHATAALLNGCSSDVGYPISDLMVIELVNFVLDQEDIGMIQDAHTLLAMWNEDSPCPIDAHCIRHDDEPVVTP
jgi:hypothetical protein